MRYFIDTEFAESPGQLDLISLALVAEDGRELYCVVSEGYGWTTDRCNPWVREHVLPNIQAADRVGMVLTPQAIKAEVLMFVGDDPAPEFWGYYADYDWVAFCWLFGAMIDLPKGWPMFCRDLIQEAKRLDVKLPHKNDLHNALLDARDLAANYRHIEPLLTALAQARAALKRIATETVCMSYLSAYVGAATTCLERDYTESKWCPRCIAAAALASAAPQPHPADAVDCH